MSSPTIIMRVGECDDRVRQWAECGPLRVVEARLDASLELAREIIDRGYDPASPVEVYRGDVLCMAWPSLGLMASLTVNSELRFVAYRPSPFSGGPASAF